MVAHGLGVPLIAGSSPAVQTIKKKEKKMTKKDLVPTKPDLIPLEKLNIELLFSSDEKIERLIAMITERALDNPPADVTTAKGRAAIISWAGKAVRCKTFIEPYIKGSVKALKDKVKVIDSRRKRLRDALDELRDRIRKPLTDYLAGEKERIAKIEDKITRLTFTEDNMQEIRNAKISRIEEVLESISKIVIKREEYFEFTDKAKKNLRESIDFLMSIRVEKEQEEKEREIALKRKKDERDRLRQERDERLAAKVRKETEEKVRKETEERVRREAKDELASAQSPLPENPAGPEETETSLFEDEAAPAAPGLPLIPVPLEGCEAEPSLDFTTSMESEGLERRDVQIRKSDPIPYTDSEYAKIAAPCKNDENSSIAVKTRRVKQYLGKYLEKFIPDWTTRQLFIAEMIDNKVPYVQILYP